MTKYLVETRAAESGSWLPLPEVFDTASQAEQYVIDFVPYNVYARIVRAHKA